MIFKKAGIPEQKYTSNSAEEFTNVCTNLTIKYEMGGSVVNRADTVKQYNKSEKMEEISERSQEA